MSIMAEYKIEGSEELLAKLEKNRLLADPIRQFLIDASLVVERRTKELTPVDTGRLWASFTHMLDASEIPLWAKVGTSVQYALFVEEDTRPHWPPLSINNPQSRGIRRWAYLHKINVYALGAAIASRGTKGKHMLRRGLAESKDKIDALFARLGEKIKQRWEE